MARRRIKRNSQSRWVNDYIYDHERLENLLQTKKEIKKDIEKLQKDLKIINESIKTTTAWLKYEAAQIKKEKL